MKQTNRELVDRLIDLSEDFRFPPDVRYKIEHIINIAKQEKTE